MRNRHLITKCLVLALMLVIAVSFSGCSKQLTKMKIKKANKILQEAQTHEAVKYAKNQYDEAKVNRDQAQAKLARKDSKGALMNAKKAVELAQQALAQSKEKRALDKLTYADDRRKIADQNNGRLENPELHQKLNDDYAKADEKYKSQKWVACIEISESVIADVRSLLLRLENKANKLLVSVDQEIKQREIEEAQKYAPNLLVELQTYRGQVDELIEVQNDYRNAIDTAGLALKKAQETATKIKERKSHEHISKITEDLATALTKGAEIYAKERFDSCNGQFLAIMVNYYEKEYDEVLRAVELLQPRIDQLVLVTKTASAKARIKAVESAITDLVEGETREYLPGRVEKIEEMVGEARLEFDVGEFERVELICANALEENERVLNEFRDLASEAIIAAQQALNIARGVFNKVDTIFEPKQSLFMTPLERDFENNKDALKTKLGETLKNNDVLLVFAHSNLEEIEYNRSIEKAEQVKANAEYVLNETYHVVAHNAIIELANSISFYETEGGEQYAANELEQTKRLLAQARQLVKAKSYEEGVNKTAETNAELETMVQVVKKRAIEEIEQAKADIGDAKETKTDVYQSQKFKDAKSLLDEAERLLGVESLKAAVETAENASKVVSAASVEAASAWAEQTINLANTEYIGAEAAGASFYAATELKKAQDLLTSAKEMFGSRQFLAAKDAAIQSAHVAEDARLKKVNEAKTAIKVAKEYNGWKYQYDILSQAIIKSNKADEFLKEKDYISSRRAAQQAVELAEAVIEKSKKKAFSETTERIDVNIKLAKREGGSYFQVKDVKSLIADLSRVRSSYTLEKHDELMAQLDLMETKVNKVIVGTPQVLKAVIAKQIEVLERLDTAEVKKLSYGEFEKARKYLNYAHLDFKKKEYRPSYLNLQKGIKVVNAIRMKHEDILYSAEVGDLSVQLTDAMHDFDAVLNMSPSAMQGIVLGLEKTSRIASIHGKFSFLDFREATDRLYALSLELTPPANREALNKTVVRMFKCAQLAARNFEKLSIADEMDERTLSSIIKNAYELTDRAKRNQKFVRSELLTKHNRARVIKAEYVNW